MTPARAFWATMSALTLILTLISARAVTVAAVETVHTTAAIAAVPRAVPGHVRWCARKADYKRVKPGMTRAKVARVLHNEGRMVYYRLIRDRTHTWRLLMVYRYQSCWPYRHVTVRYRENPRLEIRGRVVLTVTSKQLVRW